MKPGDLVTDKRRMRIGIVIEIFGDLDPSNPWVRVRWTAPFSGSEWCKGAGLELAASDMTGSVQLKKQGEP
jgi:rRNA processing protein Gar1